MKNFGKFLGGIIIGGILGAAAAFLFSPGSGESNREMLKKKAEEIRTEFEVGSEERKKELEEEVMVLRGEK